MKTKECKTNVPAEIMFQLICSQHKCASRNNVSVNMFQVFALFENWYVYCSDVFDVHHLPV